MMGLSHLLEISQSLITRIDVVTVISDDRLIEHHTKTSLSVS